MIKGEIKHFVSRVKPKQQCYITCAGREDGVGAQLQGVLSTMLFAHEMGIQYVHSPFKQIAHNQVGLEHERLWESFLNLGFDEQSISDFSLERLDIIHTDTIREIPNKTLFVVKHCHTFADHNPDRYSRILQRIRQKYKQSTIPKISYFNPRIVNVAVHIRRGDVSNQGPNQNRYTDSERIQQAIEQVILALTSMNLPFKIHLYSQGVEEDFAEFSSDFIEFHLDECPFITFHHLVSADILIMAKSSFSYSAALLSEGAKVYMPFWHRPMKSWSEFDDSAGIDTRKLTAQIQEAIQARRVS